LACVFGFFIAAAGLVSVISSVTGGNSAVVEPSAAETAAASHLTDGSVVSPEADQPLHLTASEKKAQRDARKDFANAFDNKLLTAGIESRTRTAGQLNTTLVIEDILAGRVRAKALGDNLPFTSLRLLGFKKVIYTNGLDDELGVSFSWKVE